MPTDRKTALVLGAGNACRSRMAETLDLMPSPVE